MTPLRVRVIGALELAPMSIKQLSRCLMADPAYIQRIVADLRFCGAVFESGRIRRRTCRPEKVWRLQA